MSNEIVNYNPGKATLLEMRADADRFPRIKSIPREQAVQGMVRIVSQAFLYRGQAADPTNIQFIASSLVDELLDDSRFGASNLSLAEIQVAVKRAVLGGSEMFGVSVSSLYRIILEFAKGEGRNNQQMVEAMKNRERISREYSGVRAMIQAETGEFIRNHKNK